MRTLTRVTITVSFSEPRQMHYPHIQGNNRRLEHLQVKGLPIVASSKRTDLHGKSQETFNSVSTNSGRSAFGFYFAGQPSLSSHLKQTAPPRLTGGFSDSRRWPGASRSDEQEHAHGAGPMDAVAEFVMGFQFPLHKWVAFVLG